MTTPGTASIDSTVAGPRYATTQSWELIEQAVNRIERLSAVAVYDIGAPALRQRLDELSARTCSALGLPVGLTTLVLNSAQMIAGSNGVDGWMAAAGGTPVEWSFCAHAVTTGLPYVIDNTAEDPIQSRNPLVAIDGIASYAGVPLVTADGQAIGAHCVIGAEPHHFTVAEVAVLQRAATEVLEVLEQFRL